MIATVILIIFIAGYVLITAEHAININKAATALVTGVVLWTLLALAGNTLDAFAAIPGFSPAEFFGEELAHHLSEIASILIFLLGAMTIVELIDAHDGFSLITTRITALNKVKLLWVVSGIAFFLSAVLDNLTTTIVMVSLLRKLIDKDQDRWFFAGMVIIAANAGGAWSPIGDVTTTMLWIGERISATGVITTLFLPSVASLLLPLLILSFTLKGSIQRPVTLSEGPVTNELERNVVFFAGLLALIFVPAFKTVTHLPPYMGMMLALGVVWVITELIHKGKDEVERTPLSVVGVIRRIDTPSILFFLGILLSVAALQTSGHLGYMAGFLRDKLNNITLITTAIGLLSAIVDNVPLVAGAIGMYPLETNAATVWAEAFTRDGHFWMLLAYCAGTGGSVLIIGSAAGVAAMGLENISFFWYLRRISWLALTGYFAGIGVYLLCN